MFLVHLNDVIPRCVGWGAGGVEDTSCLHLLLATFSPKIGRTFVNMETSGLDLGFPRGKARF